VGIFSAARRRTRRHRQSRTGDSWHQHDFRP
jgi:hypothetical protein